MNAIPLRELAPVISVRKWQAVGFTKLAWLLEGSLHDNKEFCGNINRKCLLKHIVFFSLWERKNKKKSKVHLSPQDSSMISTLLYKHTPKGLLIIFFRLTQHVLPYCFSSSSSRLVKWEMGSCILWLEKHSCSSYYLYWELTYP